MIWMATAPDIYIPTVDVRPVSAFIRQAPVDDVVEKFRCLILNVEASVEQCRLRLKIQASMMIGQLAANCLDGWSIDCSQVLLKLDESLVSTNKVTAEMDKELRTFVRVVTGKHLAGANTVGNSVIRLLSVLGGWSSDLEDYRDSVADLHKKMRRDRESGPVVKAMRAYAEAIERFTGFKVEPSTRIDPEDFDAVAFVNLPVSDEVRGDRSKKSEITKKVHNAVAQLDESLVGLVALRYIPNHLNS